jgi:hypothetical protein
MRLSLDVRDEGAERTLRAIARRGGDVKPAMVAMARDLEDDQAWWFATRGEGSWDGHDDGTTRRHGPHPVLDLTGTLKKSLKDAHASYAVRDVDRDSLLFGTRDPVAHLVKKARPPLAPFRRARPRLRERLRHHILALDEE